MSDDKKGFGKSDGEDAIDKINKGKGDLKSDASDAIDDGKQATESAKEKAKDLGDKAEKKFEEAKEATKEFADDAKEKASEFAEDAKEAASDFADDVKEAAKEFKEDAKEAFSPDNPDSGKTIAILAHITVIGWIIAIIMNSSNKTEFGSFYIRQTLGIWIFMLVLGFVPIVGCFAGVIGLVLIVISLIAAINGKMTATVGVGHLFQDWFKSL